MPKRARGPGETSVDESIVAGVRLTHPGRVFWGEPRITKRDLAAYYAAIEPWLLPMLRERPLSLVRCPDGIDGPRFFQKHPARAMSGEIPRLEIREKRATATYLYVRTIEDVIRLVQVGVLEFHVWCSRIDDLERPDLMIFDLDPAPDVAWPAVVRGALRLRDMLAEFRFAAFPRLTGGKGLHVVVPLVPAADWDTVKAFSYSLAERATREAPDRYTTNMSKAERTGRIFIDYLRNTRGATAIASYSSRAREGAPVAVPLRWNELGSLSPGRYGVANVRKRLASLREDPWAELDAARQPLDESSVVQPSAS